MLTTAKLYFFSFTACYFICKTQENCSKKKSSNLPIVYESLMLTFNLLTGYYSRQQPLARWRHFVGNGVRRS